MDCGTHTRNSHGATWIFTLFMALLGVFCILFEPGFGHRLYALLALCCDLGLLVVVLLVADCAAPRLSKVLRLLLYVVLYAVALVDVACYVRLQSPITPIWVEVTLLTGWDEARETLTSYVTPALLLSRVGIVVGLMLLNVAACLWRERLCERLPRLSSRTKRVGGFAAVALWVACACFSYEERVYMYYRVVRQYDELEVQQIRDFSPKAKYYLPVWRLAYSLSEVQQLRVTRLALEKGIGRAAVDSCDFTSPHIVLLIGESCNRRHTSLYGYDKQTTPHQCAMAQRGELVRFDDVVSSWNVTCESFQYMFSLYTAGDTPSISEERRHWYDYPLFTELMKRAGYDNLFLSNQFVLSKGESISAYKEDVFLNSPRLSQAQFSRRNCERHTYDEGLIDDFRRLSDPAAPHTFTIFHFLGLHTQFRERYPEAWNHFKPADYPRTDLSEGQKTILAAYDNAMRYNDHVIARIVELFRNRDCIVLFVPDHGERIFDHGTEWGRNLSWEPDDVRPQFQIPFWIWASPTYRTRHADLWQCIRQSAHRRFSTDRLPHLLLHLAGLHTPYYRPSSDLLSPDYDVHRPRIIREERDYDRLVKNPPK